MAAVTVAAMPVAMVMTATVTITTVTVTGTIIIMEAAFITIHGCGAAYTGRAGGAVITDPDGEHTVIAATAISILGIALII